LKLSITATCFFLALGALSVLPGQSAAQATAQSKGGKDLFEARCTGCHALERDKEGPRLAGVYGRTAGSVPSFQYSDALPKSKIVWDEQTLDRWLTDPDKMVPGNDMTFRVPGAEDRRKIIEFLKQQSAR
jgi:cytochrome c